MLKFHIVQDVHRAIQANRTALDTDNLILRGWFVIEVLFPNMPLEAVNAGV